MPYTLQTQITCHKCGYHNHLAMNCTVRKNPPRRGAQNPFNQNPKIQKTNYAAQGSKAQTCNEFSHRYPPEMCAVLPLEGENLS